MKYQEYWDFVEWSATPSPVRVPKTQQEFAKIKSIHNATLSKWKRVEGFDNDRWRLVTENMGDKLPDVIYALQNRIFKDGNPKAIEMFVNWARDVMPTVKVIHEGRIDVSDPETKKSIDEMNKMAKKIYYGK